MLAKKKVHMNFIKEWLNGSDVRYSAMQGRVLKCIIDHIKPSTERQEVYKPKISHGRHLQSPPKAINPY